MKKFILTFLLLIMFIPFFVNAETCDTDKIVISSIAIDSKSDNVEEIDEATFSGKDLNLNLSMTSVGDYIKYKVVVKNDSNEDYQLDKNSFNVSSDYIVYTFESEDKSYVVKANSSKVVYLKVSYKNKVPDEFFSSGTYNDKKTITVNLSNENIINVLDTLKNPNTGVQSYILIILIILLISVSIYVLLKKKQYVKFMILIIGTAILIPVSVYAICKCEIMVKSNIIIQEEPKEMFIVTTNMMNIGQAIPDEVNLKETKEEAIADWTSITSDHSTGPFYLKHTIANPTMWCVSEVTTYVTVPAKSGYCIVGTIDGQEVSTCTDPGYMFVNESLCNNYIQMMQNEGYNQELICKSGSTQGGTFSAGFSSLRACETALEEEKSYGVDLTGASCSAKRYNSCNDENVSYANENECSENIHKYTEKCIERPIANSKKIIKESYVGFVITEEMAEANPGMIVGTYYLKGGDSGKSFEDNKKILERAFDYANHSDRCGYRWHINSFGCSINNFSAFSEPGGSVYVYGNGYYCNVNSDGSSYCAEEPHE